MNYLDFEKELEILDKNLEELKNPFNQEDGLYSMVEYIRQRGISKFNRHIPVEIISDLTPKTWISDRMNQK